MTAGRRPRTSRNGQFHYVAVGKDRDRRPLGRRGRLTIRVIGVVAALGLAVGAVLYARDRNASQRLSVSERRALHSWVAAHNADFSHLAAAITSVGAATSRVDAKSTGPDPTLVRACTALKVQATEMQALPPIPGTALRRHLSAGLRSDITAALRCLQAAQRGPANNLGILTQSHASLAEGGTEMQALATLINANGVSSR